MILPDAEARRRALTEIDRTMLVEAAAGTGKTSVIAGRVAMLLAAGRPPGTIAALTFSEAAAGELASRIRRMVERLRDGNIPRELLPALPDGLDADQRVAISGAAAHLDELIATTIHGFCHGLVRAHAVEAGIDPGAVVMDADQADNMFDRVFDAWLVRRLSVPPDDDDPVMVIALDDPDHAIRTIRGLAELRRRNPMARAGGSAPGSRPDVTFVEAVGDFSRWYETGPAEPATAVVLDDLAELAACYEESLRGAPNFRRLWALSRPPQLASMRLDGLGLRPYGVDERAWRAVAHATEAAALAAAARVRHEACALAFADLLGAVGGGLLAALSGALEELLDDYERAKREAAALDFDDLLLKTARLLRGHEPVRRAIGQRYRHLLVDEFQDTDPTQASIILAIVGGAGDRPRPGALFVVGDPKQSIYRFRGADVATYSAVKDGLAGADPDGVVLLTANFRSVPGILNHVNRCFEAPLDGPGQPGHVALVATLAPPPGGTPSVTRLRVDAPHGARAEGRRDAEAAAVAALCAELIGNVDVRRDDGSASPLRAGDVALLSMTHTDLWRYERALSDAGLPVAPQAGKALMRRQETQDFLALVRTLADPGDTLALGALLRGPLVGLTEAELLAAMAGLSRAPDGGLGRLSVRSDPVSVANPVLRDVLARLRELRSAAPGLTPAALLATAVERLRVRVALALRSRERDGRAQANLDVLLRRARAFATRGLSAFAADLQGRWEAGEALFEGRCDERDDAVALVTVHASKGLEWPVVVVVNGGTRRRPTDDMLHRRSDGTLHWTFHDLASDGHARARADEEDADRLERERLWYVACTRPRDLLILPHLPDAHASAWSRVVDLRHGELPYIDVAASTTSVPVGRTADTNGQSADVFAAESARVAAASPAISWRTPSEHDADRRAHAEVGGTEAGSAANEASDPVGPGRERGVLIHKLLEEMLTGELAEEAGAARLRAAVLMRQLAVSPADAADRPDPDECAATALAALALPDVASLRPNLVSEFPIHAPGGEGELVTGRADAIAVEGGRITAVVDWKSDVAPTDAARRAHAGQMAEYLAATGAVRGAIVYVTRSEVTWVERDGHLVG